MVGRMDTLEAMARLGYAARGVVYLIIGVLALLAAFGSTGETTGSKGALEQILRQPFGAVALALVCLGLLGFALWRFVEAALDLDLAGDGVKRLVRRGAKVVSGVLYLSLCAAGAGLLVGVAARQEDASARDWTAWLLAQPFGPWLVGGVGLAVIGAGLAMAWRGWTAAFRQHLACSADQGRWVVPLGRAGHIARGVVFVLIGVFLIRAAIQFDPSEAIGLAGALQQLEARPYGWVALGAVAAGLAAFGLFGLMEARFRRVEAPDPHRLVPEAMRN